MKPQEIINLYESCLKRIKVWNDIVSNPNMTEQEKVQTQLDCSVEEAKETILAILTKDNKNIMDGVADILVTSGHLINTYIYPFHYTSYDFGQVNEDMIKELALTPSEDDMLCSVAELYSKLARCKELSHEDILVILTIFFAKYGDDLKKYIHAVLSSNDTKYVSFNDDVVDDTEMELQDRLDKLLSYANLKYGDDHGEIVVTTVNYENKPYYVLRADGGKGKVLKPYTYKEPSEFL